MQLAYLQFACDYYRVQYAQNLILRLRHIPCLQDFGAYSSPREATMPHIAVPSLAQWVPRLLPRPQYIFGIRYSQNALQRLHLVSLFLSALKDDISLASLPYAASAKLCRRMDPPSVTVQFYGTTLGNLPGGSTRNLWIRKPVL